MPLVSDETQAARCPDRVRADGGRGCRHLLLGRGCALKEHPVCEEFLRKNPSWQPADDQRVRGTAEGERMQRGLGCQEGEEYRRSVAAGTWFSDPAWREHGARLVRLGRGQDTTEPGNSTAASTEDNQSSQLTPSEIGKFRRYPVRRSRSIHDCGVCRSSINPGDMYHDGGSPTLRAHQGCVAASPVEISMVGPPTADDIEQLERMGQDIMVESPTMGALWLVPKLTGREDRKEMTFRNFHRLCLLAASFPGTRVTRVSRPGHEQEDVPGAPVEVRCTCHPEARDRGCPVRAHLGENHPLATRVLLECSCEPGWTVEQQRHGCAIGRAFGGHKIAAETPRPRKVTCTCGESKNPYCPVGRAVGNHKAGASAELACTCEPGWNIEKQLSKCEVGRVLGQHLADFRRHNHDQ